MAKTTPRGENRGRRATDRRRAAEEQGETAGQRGSTADDRAVAGDPATTGGRLAARATRQEVALRAYEIFTKRGGTHGYDLEDWLQAERELLGK